MLLFDGWHPLLLNSFFPPSNWEKIVRKRHAMGKEGENGGKPDISLTGSCSWKLQTLFLVSQGSGAINLASRLLHNHVRRRNLSKMYMISLQAQLGEWRIPILFWQQSSAEDLLCRRFLHSPVYAYEVQSEVPSKNKKPSVWQKFKRLLQVGGVNLRWHNILTIEERHELSNLMDSAKEWKL